MISVVIPVHNGEAYLREAVDSVLNQTCPPDQVLVIDDGSTDGTPAVAESFGTRIEYVAQAQAGPGAARSLGIQRARGEFVAFLDADDLWAPQKLELQMQAFAEDSGLDLVFCNMAQFRSPELPPEVAATIACDERPQPSPLISCLLARRQAFEQIPLRTDVKTEFVDWLLRAREAGLVERTLGHVLVRRRLHADNLTRRDQATVRKHYLQLIKQSLDRRRLQQTSR